MLDLESEATKKICPVVLRAGSMVGGIAPGACVASACMGWRVYGIDGRGYCGMAGMLADIVSDAIFDAVRNV